MDLKKTDPAEALLSPAIPFVRIDGTGIKRIREEKGLTQLYLSETVGVTTDTISRWENRRYPSIKLENAQKLAQALEVELEEILEKEEEVPGDRTLEPATGQEQPPRTRLIAGLALGTVLAFAVAGFFFWYFLYFLPGKNAMPPVTAIRILPPHAPAGQIFPVLIRVQNPADASITLILKESIPADTTVESGVPPFTTLDTESHELKWISRTDNVRTVFSYIARTPATAVEKSLLVFNGSVTLKQPSHSDTTIHGNSTVAVLPFHWADSNMDGMIDDEEILAVYDLYSDIHGLAFDRNLIDEIWAAGGYRWDGETGQYIVRE